MVTVRGYQLLRVRLYNCKILRKRIREENVASVTRTQPVSLKKIAPTKSVQSYFSVSHKGTLGPSLHPEPSHHVFSLNFRDRPFFYSNLHSYNYSVLVQIWCQPLLSDLCPLWSEQKCVSWLTTGWGTWLHRRHLVLSNRGDSLLGSLWKLTAKHSQLDLRYLERLSFSPWIKGGLHKTCTRLQQINVSLVACQHASPSKIRTIKHIACKLWRWLKLYICEHIWDTFNYKFGITRSIGDALFL